MKEIWSIVFALVICGYWIGDILSEFKLIWFMKLLIPAAITFVGWVIYKLYESYFAKRISVDRYRSAVILFLGVLGIVDVVVENNANVMIFISLMIFSGAIISLLVENRSVDRT